MAILRDDNYVDKAEDVVLSFKALEKKYQKEKGRYTPLTTSKIRNLLSLTSTLYDESSTKEFSQLQEPLSYLRVQFVYQAGRERSVKELVEKAQILEILKEIRDISSLQRFCRYMEALVAYFKYYGGKD